MTSIVDQFSKISYLMIETNSNCNLKCIFCNREELVKSGQRNPLVLDEGEFEKLLLPFKDCPIDTIKVEGLSEPMLNPHFAKCLKKIRSYFPKAFIIIATNLQYNIIKSPFLDSLKYVDMVYLSIDGINEVYEEMRLGASYEKLLKSLNEIKASTTEEQRKKLLHINFTLSEKNYMQLSEIYLLKSFYGLAGVRINLAQNWNEDQKNTYKFSEELLMAVSEYKEDLKGVPAWKYNSCFWPFEGIVVDCFGDFRQCVINTSQKALGNLFKDDVRSIYNSSVHYVKMRDGLKRNLPTESCKNCDYNTLGPILKKVFGDQDVPNSPRKFEILS